MGINLKSKVYFGNWLRDYSQAVDVGTVKYVSAEAIRLILWVLGFMSFGYGTKGKLLSKNKKLKLSALRKQLTKGYQIRIRGDYRTARLLSSRGAHRQSQGLR